MIEYSAYDVAARDANDREDGANRKIRNEWNVDPEKREYDQL
jgi:hypothetical protein